MGELGQLFTALDTHAEISGSNPAVYQLFLGASYCSLSSNGHCRL